jgi:hypothetical protein
MSSKAVGGVPPYPTAPPGVSRLGHLPTVEASICYWEAIEKRARRINDYTLMRTAAGLKSSYEASRLELLKAADARALPLKTCK